MQAEKGSSFLLIVNNNTYHTLFTITTEIKSEKTELF